VRVSISLLSVILRSLLLQTTVRTLGILITGYATASGWTLVTELLLLATTVTRALSIRHYAKGNRLGYDSRGAVYQDGVQCAFSG
jgi:hypothetical protein